MGERRFEDLVINKEQVEKVAKKKAAKLTLIVSVIIFVLLILPIAFASKQLELYILMIPCIMSIILFIMMYNILKFAFMEEEERLISKNFVEKNLSSKDKTEVVPINASEHKEFLLNLTNIAKYYAIINQDTGNIYIYVKFNSEKDMRYLETQEMDFFMNYYSILIKKET